ARALVRAGRAPSPVRGHGPAHRPELRPGRRLHGGRLGRRDAGPARAVRRGRGDGLRRLGAEREADGAVPHGGTEEGHREIPAAGVIGGEGPSPGTPTRAYIPTATDGPRRGGLVLGPAGRTVTWHRRSQSSQWWAPPARRAAASSAPSSRTPSGASPSGPS